MTENQNSDRNHTDEEVARLVVEDVREYSKIGREYFNRGFFEESIQTLDEGTEVASLQLAIIYHFRGRSKHKLGKIEEAVIDFDKSIDLHPQSASYSDRGALRLELGRIEEAIFDLDKAIELDSKNSVAYANRGYAKVRFIRNFEEALKDLDKAIELDPNSADAHLNRGIARSVFGGFEEALKDFNNAINLDPTIARAYNWRGENLEYFGKTNEARKDYRAALNLLEKIPETYLDKRQAEQLVVSINGLLRVGIEEDWKDIPQKVEKYTALAKSKGVKL